MAINPISKIKDVASKIKSTYKTKVSPYVGKENTGGSSLVDLPGLIYQTKKYESPNQIGVNANFPSESQKRNTLTDAQRKPITTDPQIETNKKLQIDLNNKNAGQVGWTPLKVDGIIGEKTKAAQSFTPIANTSTQDWNKYRSQPEEKVQETKVKDTKVKEEKPAVDPTSRKGLLTTLTEMGTRTPDAIKQATDLVTQRQQEYNDLIRQKGEALGKLELEPMTVGMKSGISQQIQENYNARIDAASRALEQANTQLGLANTQFGTQAGIVSGALSQQAPVMQFGQLTSPDTGAPISADTYGGNQQLQTAVNQAVQLVQAGASPNDPQVTALLSTFGLPGQSLFTQAMQQVNNGTYNPTAMATQVATNVGLGSEYQKQSVMLDTALKQLDTITPYVNNFLAKSGLNQEENPFFNRSIKAYSAQLQNPADVTSLNAIMGDVKKYTAQILGATGELNPTEIASINQTFDPSDLSGSQLKVFLANLDNLGKNQLAVLQSQTSGAYGGKGGYTGANAEIVTDPIMGTQNAPSWLNTQDTTLQGLAGGAMKSWSDLIGFVRSIF